LIAQPQFFPGDSGEAATVVRAPGDVRWGLDYFGLLGYLFVEYTRIAVVYPALAPLQLGKVTLLTAMLGLLASPAPPSAASNGRVKAAVIALGAATALSALAAHYKVFPIAPLLNMPEQLIAVFLLGRFVSNRWRQQGVLLLIMLTMMKVAQHGLRVYHAEHGRAENEMAFVQFGIIGGGGGFYDNSADLGVAMCVVFGLALALFQANIGRKSRLLYLIGVLAFGSLIVVCGSRGAIVGASAIILAAWIKSPKKTWAPVFVILFVVALVFLMPHASRDRFQSAEHWQNDKTANHRVLLWQAGLRMWHDNPIFGVGPANYQYVRAAKYRIDVDEDMDRRAYVCHSLYIEIVSELGTLGALAVITIIIFYFATTWKIRHRLRSIGADVQSWEFCLCSGCELAMIGYLVSGAFVSVFWYPHIWVLTGIVMGLNTSTELLEQSSVASNGRLLSRAAVAVI
jgi:O-antigen ligase